MLLPATDASLAPVADCLNHGGVVIIPTDTVYGLAAHPAFPDAVSRLYTLKNRAAAKPIAMLASDATILDTLGITLPTPLTSLTQTAWPGALTLVVDLPSGATEGIRVPDHAWTRALIARCGGLLRVTSANLSGAMPACSAQASLADIGLQADIVVDDGISPGGVASTVIRANPLTLLRQGPIAFDPTC